jgi:hypothetical protein
MSDTTTVTRTVVEVISDAHLFAGVGDAVNALDANTVALGLRIFNGLIDSWSTEELTVFDIVEGTFPLIPGSATYQIGPAQSLGVRPVSVERISIVDAQNVTHPVRIIGVDEWSQIIYKPAVGRPDVMYNDNNVPVSNWAFWPVPSFAADVLHAWYWNAIQQNATLTATIVPPPGYIWFMTTNLGVALAPFHRKPVTADMNRIAGDAYWNARALNRQPKIMNTDIPRGVGPNRPGYNIYSDS